MTISNSQDTSFINSTSAISTTSEDATSTMENSSQSVETDNSANATNGLDPNREHVSRNSSFRKQNFPLVASTTGHTGGNKIEDGKDGKEKRSPRSYCRLDTSTFSGQASLPRLPIPTLEETMTRFPDVVRALLTSIDDDGLSSPDSSNNDISDETNGGRIKNCNKEIEECNAAVEKFLTVDGPPLQKLLEEYENEGRRDGTIGSYVEEFWTEAYLAPDCSVVLNLNPFFVLEDGPDTKKSKNQTSRAASLCFSAVKFASSLRNETIVPDAFRGKPLCMDQFRALFGACRVPEISKKDTVVVNPESSHIVVLENNQMYFFQALWPDGTVAVSEEDIADILQAIKADASQVAPEASCKKALGVLTTLPRREWALARDLILKSSVHNLKAMDVIDGALFVLVIDDVAPKDIHEAAANMLHGTYNLRSEDDLIDYQAGTCCNRWYDKLQIIVCQDGRAGINFEHSAIDGHTALRLVSDIFADNVVSFAQSITKTIYSDAKMFPPMIEAKVKRAVMMGDHKGNVCGYVGTHPELVTAPRKLNFELPQRVLDKIYYAETALSDQIVASDTHVLEFTGFGKNLITRNKMSPDSFVQLSMLLAYYRLYGKVVCQYEPVLTKAFYHGRTEAMRTATDKAAFFCKLWLDPSASKEDKLDALREATKYHSECVKLSAKGKGVDRHLFALKCIAEKNALPVPDFFSSTAYKKLNYTILSTSNCGNPSLRLFGFGPVVPDGFGIGYIIRDNGLQYSISSKHRQTKRFSNTLKQTLLDMGDLLHQMSSVKVVRNSFSFDSKTNEAPDSVEYLEGYNDVYGETNCEIEPISNSMKKVDISAKESGGIPPSGFASVVHRKSSFNALTLRAFGSSLGSFNDLESSDFDKSEKG